MKTIKLLALTVLSTVTLMISSCAPGSGLVINILPSIPVGGGGYGGQACGPQGRPIPRQNCGGGGNPLLQNYNQRSCPMPMNGTNNFPGGGQQQGARHPSGYQLQYQPGSQLPQRVSSNPSSRYYAGNYVRDSGGYNPSNPNINYTSGGNTVHVGRFGEAR